MSRSEEAQECKGVLPLEPIVVIGLACRFPGDAKDIESLWKCLLEGRSMATKIPHRTFNANGFYHPDPDHGGSIYTDTGHFLAEDTTSFDAPFFSLSKNEITSMDPQQRIVLENTYQALENAGLKMEDIVGTQTSVFIGGGFAQDYLHSINQDTEMILKMKATGTSTALLSNRVSWFYDLKGTSMTIDTACSSSLVALHQACQDIRSGQSETAIVSGVNTINFPGTMLALGNLGVLSPDGKCYSFDHRANGYGRGEGVGTVIIKRLDAALRAKNTIRAVIRATGSNQDGRTPGIALPSMAAQERLIKQIYADAKLDMSLTRYVEAHGTGTAAGDPIEARAISAAFGSSNNENGPIYLGSIKGNIGHLESAAGIAGVIKAILMVERGMIPPSSNFERINPKIPLEKWGMCITTKALEWPSGVRRVSVNSFGFGGTNAHAVIDDAGSFLDENEVHALRANKSLISKPTIVESIGIGMVSGTEGSYSNGLNLASGCSADKSNQTNDMHRPELVAHTKSQSRIFLFSTPDEAGIKNNVSKLGHYLETHDQMPDKEEHYLRDLAFTLGAKRSMFKWRSFCIADSRKSLISEMLNGTSRPVQKARQAPKVGFVFTGQGAQWAGMGRALGVFPVFKESVESASAFLQALGSPWALKDLLFRPDANGSDVNDPFLAQAGCAVVQIALIDLLASWSIFPSRVLGHSSGEIAAAYCVGFVGRHDAWKLAYYRGFVSTIQSNRKGAMAAVGMSANETLSYLQSHQMDGQATVACHNSPKNTTVSGDAQCIDQLCEALNRDNIFARKLAVRNAYHSSHMEAVAGQYLCLIGDLSKKVHLRPSLPGVEMVSSVTGKLANFEQVNDARYWVQNLVKPVLFTEALLAMTAGKQTNNGSRRLRVGTKLDGTSVQHIIEIGPHSALRSAIRDSLFLKTEASSIAYHSVLTRNADDIKTILTTAATLYCHSYPVEIAVVNSWGTTDAPKMLTDLPPYEFNHAIQYWKESRLSKNFRTRGVPRHDLFGAPVSDWNPAEPRWRGFLRVCELPWLKDHKITGNYIFPGVGYLVMAIEAAKQISDATKTIIGFKLQDVALKTALNIPDTADGIEYILSMRDKTENNRSRSMNWREFTVSSCSLDGIHWTEHCSGSIMTVFETVTGEVDGGREALAESHANSETLAEAERRCQGEVGTDYTYDAWKSIGMEFGPTFRNVSDMRVGHGKGHALSMVTVPDIGAIMPNNFIHPHIIQPATLDSILQTFMVAIVDLRGNGSLKRPELPTFIREVWISSNLSNAVGATFKCYSEAEQVSSKQYETGITVWDGTTRQLVVKISGIETKPLDVGTASSPDGLEHMCYFVEWQPDVNMLSKRSDVFQRMIPVAAFDVGRHRDNLKRCQTIAKIYIERARERVQELDINSLQGHQRKYIEWLAAQAASVSMYGCNTYEDSVVLDKMRDNLSPPEHNVSAREELLHVLGPNIIPILRGQADALDLMFSHGDLMNRFYQETSAPGNITPLLKSYLKALSVTSPALRVLEIGAGTGSTTATVLEVLNSSASMSAKKDSEDCSSRIASYTYTDVSAGFFKGAKEKFGSWASVMDFRILNIEISPVDQGFDEGIYDLVIASNVLHATKHLSETLKHARSLLKSGGKLLLVEIVQPEFLFNQLCFGLLPGWWLGIESFRSSGPLIIESKWDQVLRHSHFSGLDIVLKDVEDEEMHEISVMISSAEPTDMVLNGTQEKVPIYLICESHQQATHQSTIIIEARLIEAGFKTCTLLNYHDFPSNNVKLESALCISFIGLGNTDLSRITDTEFASIQHILSHASRLMWVSTWEVQKPEAAMATGLIRSVRWERDFDSVDFSILSVEDTFIEPESLALSILRCVQGDRERNEEYTLKDGELWVSRVRESAKTTRYMRQKSGQLEASPQRIGDSSVHLTTESPGLLNKLVFESASISKQPLGDTEVEVKIHACGLNFMDVMIAMGQLAKLSMGLEASGYVARVGPRVKCLSVGDRVVCFAVERERGCFQTNFRTDETTVTKVPATMDLEQAASIPLVFMTAIYSLSRTAKITREETILIHSAAGGVGQAAIQIAQLAKAEVFATVSTVEKKDLLINMYGIPGDHIFSSRDTSFVRGIQRMTQGKGVDVVLNSLSGEALHGTWDCVAPFGRFIELGKKDIITNARLPMSQFLNNVTYSAVDIKAIMELKPAVAMALIREALELFEQGKLRVPSPLTAYSFSDIETAFRKLQLGKTMGKIILKPHENDIVQMMPKVLAPFQFDSSASYVLAGGLGGIGRSLARWMFSRGARNIIFLSRSGGKSAEAQDLIKNLEDGACQVQILACDISNEEQLKGYIEECRATMPSIKGCIQGSMVLEDSMFVNMTHRQFQAAIGPKVRGSRNLQSVLGNDLDFFVMLSSITAVVGNRGQANYAAGNAYQDAFARQLVSKDIRAASINLGTIKAVGYVAENRERIQKQGEIFTQWDGLSEEELHCVIEYHIDPRVKFNDEGRRFQSIAGLMTAPAIAKKGIPLPAFMNYPLFKQLHTIGHSSVAIDEEKGFPIQKLLSRCENLASAAKYIEEALQLQLLSMMSIPKEEFDPYKPLVAYRVDSLIAVEIRTWISKSMGADIAIFDVLGSNSITEFSNKVAGMSNLVRVAKIP